MKPDDKTLEALARLERHDADWLTVRDWLAKELTDTQGHLMAARDDVTLRQMQGRAQTLTALLQAAAEAPEIVRNR